MAHVQQFQISLGDRGRIVLPSAVREQFGLQPGDRLVLIVEDTGEMRLVSLKKQIERCMGMFSYDPARTMPSEDLIAEREREARREEE